jgi:hypothetical protein
MKIVIAILNIAIITYMAVIYANYVNASEIEHLQMMIEIERAVGQAIQI